MDHLIQTYAPVPAGNPAKFLFEPVEAFPAYSQSATTKDGIVV